MRTKMVATLKLRYSYCITYKLLDNIPCMQSFKKESVKIVLPEPVDRSWEWISRIFPHKEWWDWPHERVLFFEWWCRRKCLKWNFVWEEKMENVEMRYSSICIWFSSRHETLLHILSILGNRVSRVPIFESRFRYWYWPGLRFESDSELILYRA